MLIAADIHEKRSGVPDHLERLGLTVQIGPLPVGDYVVGGVTLVERKTVRSVHAAIMEGSFWPQLGRLRRATRRSFLVVEGADLDDGPLSPSSIRGVCLTVVELGIVLLRSCDGRDTALWLSRLAHRHGGARRRDRPAYAQSPSARSKAEAAEAALSAVPGISAVSARALLVEFGTLAAVIAAGPESWQKVRGIGPKRALGLAEVLEHSRRSP